MISAAAYAVAGIFVLAMMVQIVADVVLRSLFNWPIMGSLEIVSNYYMVGVAFLPLAMLQLQKSFVFVEVFTQNLRKSVTQALDRVSQVLGILVLGLIAISSGLYAWEKTASGEYLNIVYYDLLIWPTRWVSTIGFGLAMIASITVLIMSFRKGEKETCCSDSEDVDND